MVVTYSCPPLLLHVVHICCLSPLSVVPPSLRLFYVFLRQRGIRVPASELKAVLVSGKIILLPRTESWRRTISWHIVVTCKVPISRFEPRCNRPRRRLAAALKSNPFTQSTWPRQRKRSQSRRGPCSATASAKQPPHWISLPSPPHTSEKSNMKVFGSSPRLWQRNRPKLWLHEGPRDRKFKQEGTSSRW